MPNPTAAMLVIGDEILSGRTRDSNLHHLARALTDHGIALKEARVVSDDHDAECGTLDPLAGPRGPTHDPAAPIIPGMHVGPNGSGAGR